MSNETLLTIAKRTGYSITTVSRVLNGNAHKYRISDSTSRTIKEEALKCNYTPSLLAKGLRTRSSYTLGLLVPSLDNYYFSILASSVIKEARSCDYTVLTICSQENESNEKDSLRQLISRRVDGIIAVPTGENPKNFESIAKTTPVLFIDRYFTTSSLPYVCTNNYDGALKATEYLISKGHRKIACIQGPHHQAPVQERIKGYNDAMKHAGLQKYSTVVGEDFSIENGYIETKLLLSYNDRPTAILALSNTILLGAIKAISEAGMSIPDDVSIISFDSNQFLDYMTPSITRIEQPAQGIGILATRTIIKSLQEKKTLTSAENSAQLQPRLIIGESVKTL